MTIPFSGLLKCGMAKKQTVEPREIFLGDWLKRWDIGPTEAARIAGCTQSYISNISRGARKNVNALILLPLTEKYGININDLFRKPPTEAQIASFKALSPEAQDALLRPKRQKRG